MKRLPVVLLIIILCSFAYTQEQMPLLFPRTAAYFASQTGATALQNFTGNQALYAVPAGPLFQIFFTSWLYCNPFTTDVPALFTLNQNNQISAALSTQLATNGFGAGFDAGLGWSGRGIGLGIGITVDQYTKTVSTTETIGLIQGKVSIIIGYGVTFISADSVSLMLGADVRPYIRFEGHSTESSIASFIAMISGRASESFMNIPVYTGASAELNAGALLVLGKVLSIGLTAHGFTPQQTYQSTTIGNLFNAFSSEQASGQRVYMSTPRIALGTSLHILPLLGINSSTKIILTAELTDSISALQRVETFFTHTGAGITISLFNGGIEGAIGYKNAVLSYGLALRAWFITLEALLFTENTGTNDAKQGFSYGITIRF